MTKFVCCGRSGVVGSDDYGCVGLYRAIDPTIPEDLPRVVLQILGV